MISINSDLSQYLDSKKQKYIFIKYTTSDGARWLTNENLQINSMEIKEEICTDEVLKFGKFNSNYFSILSNTQIEVGSDLNVYIADNTVSTSNVETSNHSLKLGFYKVTDCKKDNNKLYRITAYGNKYAKQHESALAFEAWKYSQMSIIPYAYKQNLYCLLYAHGYDLGIGYTDMTWEDTEEETRDLTITAYNNATRSDRNTIKVICQAMSLNMMYTDPSHRYERGEHLHEILVRINGSNSHYSSYVGNYIKNKYYNSGWGSENFVPEGDSSLKSIILNGLKPFIRHVAYLPGGAARSVSYFTFDEIDSGWFYPYGADYSDIWTSQSHSCQSLYDLVVPMWVEVYNSSGETRITELELYSYDIAPFITMRKFNQELNVELIKKQTVKLTKDYASECYVTKNSLDYQGMIEGCFEVNASFGVQNRNGDIVAKRVTPQQLEDFVCNDAFTTFMHLSPVYPRDNLTLPRIGGTLKNNIMQNEIIIESTQDYSYVRVAYLNQNGDKVQRTIELGGNTSNVYDMSDNELLNKYNFTDEQVDWVINNLFKPYIQNIAYTPCDIELKAMPNYEVGDRIAFADGDEEYKYKSTIILSRTLKGDQFMIDNFVNYGAVIDPNSEYYLANRVIIESEG